MESIKNYILLCIVTLTYSGNCSQHKPLIDSEAIVECSAPVFLFENPCYREHPDVERSMGMKTVEIACIPNGSMLNFAAASVVGSVIRIASRFNEIPNPL